MLSANLLNMRNGREVIFVVCLAKVGMSTMISMPWGIYTVYTNTSERAIEKSIHMFDKISISAPVIRLCLFLTININVRVVVNTITILFDFRRI